MKIKILFLGYDPNHFKVMNFLNNNGYAVCCAGYDDIKLPIDITKVAMDNISLEDYKVIFVSNFLNSANPAISDESSIDEILSRVMQIKNLNKMDILEFVNYLFDELKNNLTYDVGEARVFVFGYDAVGLKLVEKLIELGSKVRVGTMSREEFDSLVKQHINCVYSNKLETIKRLIEEDEIVINTQRPDNKELEISNSCFININNYDRGNLKKLSIGHKNVSD